MEEKSENLNNDKLFDIWNSRLIFFSTYLLIVVSFLFGKVGIKKYITGFDEKLGNFYNIFSLILGILIIIGVAFISYKLFIRKNEKLTKENIKSVLWKISIIMLLIFYILIFIKAKKVEECRPIIFRGVSLTTSGENKDKTIGQFDWRPYIDYENVNEYISINELDFIIYETFLILTIILALLFIRIKLTKKEYISSNIVSTNLLSYLLRYLLSIFMILIILIPNIRALEEVITNEIILNALIIIPFFISILSVNFYDKNKFNIKKSLLYMLITIVVFASFYKNLQYNKIFYYIFILF